VAVEDPDISCKAPTEEEIIAGLRKLKNSKAPGCCDIAPEMLKERGTCSGVMADFSVPVHMERWRDTAGLVKGNYYGCTLIALTPAINA